MPIYEYECRSCGHQFELIVLPGTVVACPSCQAQAQDLDRLLSGFAVSSKEIRAANVQKARVRNFHSTNARDARVHELEEFKEHVQEHYGPHAIVGPNDPKPNPKPTPRPRKRKV